MPLQPWQLSASLLHASAGKHVATVSQSCQQHIPDGTGAGVVVVVVHLSSHEVTQAAKTAGLVGHPAMQAESEPPGQSLGLGLGLGVAVVVVDTGQSSLHTEIQISYAAPVTTEHAAIQASMDPPGQSPEGDGDGVVVGLAGLGGGAGVGGTFGLVVSMSPTFKFIMEYDESG